MSIGSMEVYVCDKYWLYNLYSTDLENSGSEENKVAPFWMHTSKKFPI